MEAVRNILASSIEIKANTSNTSIEIPEQIDALIDNKMFRNKFRSLIKRGFLSQLTQLAEIAKSKTAPSRWFAKATSKAMWDRTLRFLEECANMYETAVQVARNLRTDVSLFVLKACWKLRGDAVRMSVEANETGKRPLHLFLWMSNRYEGRQSL